LVFSSKVDRDGEGFCGDGGGDYCSDTTPFFNHISSSNGDGQKGLLFTIYSPLLPRKKRQKRKNNEEKKK